MRDPLNPFHDVEEEVQGPFEEGDKVWWVDRDGQAHRIDGPAIKDKKTGKVSWALHGKEVSELEVADYRLKLEQEHERRVEADRQRQVEADAAEFHTGLKDKMEVDPPLSYKKKTPPKIWK